jgi:hypothetical protein
MGEGARTAATLPRTYFQKMRVENNRGTAKEGAIGGYRIDKDTSQKKSNGCSRKGCSQCSEKKQKPINGHLQLGTEVNQTF